MNNLSKELKKQFTKERGMSQGQELDRAFRRRVIMGTSTVIVTIIAWMMLFLIIGGVVYTSLAITMGLI